MNKNDRCTVETVNFHAADTKGHGHAERFLMHGGTVIVTTGALSCTRGVLNSARSVGLAGRVICADCTRSEYACGRQGEAIGRALNEALRIKGTSLVILYASCLDVLAQTDFDSIIRNADNPGNIPVKVFFRGPMVKRMMDVPGEAEKILSLTEPKDCTLSNDQVALPGMCPDFSSVCSILQHWDCYVFLMDAGGCPGCITDTGSGQECTPIKSSRLDDVQLATGPEKLIENGILSDITESGMTGKTAFLIGSSTLSFAGVDYEGIAAAVENNGIETVLVSSSGFAPGPIGAEELFMRTAEKLVRTPIRKDPSRVNILGFDPVIFKDTGKIAHGIEHLEKRGLNGYIWGYEGMDDIRISSEASLNWVVSAEGMSLAEYMKDAFGIPYITGIPIGKNAMLEWRKKVNVLTDRDDEELEEPSGPNSFCSVSAAVIGEPMLSWSVRNCLTGSIGIKDVRILCQDTPDGMLEEFYSRMLPYGKEILYSHDAESLRELTKDCGAVIADPVYKAFLNDKRFVSIPYPLISGTEYTSSEYMIFGKKGEAYLRKGLDLNQ